jgi:hypothetical protein
MKVMEDNHLAKFCHNYPATTDNLGRETAIIFPLERSHLSCKATFTFQKGSPYKREITVSFSSLNM